MMNQYKNRKAYYEAVNPGEEFPPSNSLNTAQATEILSCLAQNLAGLESLRETLRVLEFREIAGLNAESEHFNAANIFNESKIQPGDNIFMVWIGHPDVEQFESTTFINYFDYLWYPSSDDILIFNDTFKWIILVSHEGEVKVVKQ